MRTLACLILPALLAAACGGNVVVDGSAGGTTTTKTSTTSLCVTACEALVMACPSNNPGEDCAASCAKQDAAFEAACPQAYQAFLTCLVENPSALCHPDMPTACQTQINAFVTCETKVCAATPSVCM